VRVAVCGDAEVDGCDRRLAHQLRRHTDDRAEHDALPVTRPERAQAVYVALDIEQRVRLRLEARVIAARVEPLPNQRVIGR
jgi:hypothetical protein